MNSAQTAGPIGEREAVPDSVAREDGDYVAVDRIDLDGPGHTLPPS
jgi:hypothetical protein